MFACGVCEAVFSKAEEVENHRKTAHEQRTDFVVVDSAFCRQAQLLRAFIPEETGKNIDETFVYAFTQICKLIKELKVEFKYMKCGSVLHVEMARYNEEGLLTEVKVFPFRGFSMCISRLTSEYEVKADVARVVGDYERALEEFLHMGSGWTVLRGMFLEVEVSQCLPLAGFAPQRNCTLHIVKYNARAGCAKAQNFCNRPLEPELAEEKVNCFYLAVAAYYTKNFFWSDNGKMIERARELFHFVPKGVADADGFTIEDISTFERLNEDELPMSICVLYRDEDKDIFPVRLGNGKEEYDQITLLLYYTNEGELHFALVADPGRVLARRSRQSTGKLQTCSVFLCNKCCNVLVSEALNIYRLFCINPCLSTSSSLQSSKAAYDAHQKFCVKKFEKPSIRMPVDDVKSFDSSKKSNDPRCFKLALMAFADFEALQVPPESKCSCDEGVLPPATQEELEDELLEEEMLIMEAHELWAELDDLLDMVRQYNVEEKRPDLKRKLSTSSSPSPPLRRRIRPLSKKEFIPPPLPRRLPSSNTFFGPFTLRSKTEEEREEEVCEDALIFGQAADAYAAQEAAIARAERLYRDKRRGNSYWRSGYNLKSFLPSRAVRKQRCPHRVQVLAEQPPFCYSFVLTDREGQVLEHKTFYGEPDAVADNFLLTVLNVADTYLPALSAGGTPMDKLTEQEEEIVRTATHCYLCEGIFHDEGEKRVRDHDHLTGKFLGMAHNDCNLARRELYQLCIFTHNFSGYDSHFLIRALSRFPERIHTIDAIPLTTQKFKTITVNRRIKFLDSCAFLPDSLDNLVKTLVKSGSTFPILEQLVSGEKKELMKEKGVYPYSFATSLERLREAKTLPGKRHFYSDLNMKECSDEEYKRAQKVWDTFECKNMLTYTSIYVQSDVFLLADVVVDFRENVWKSFGLDICSYLSLPHLSFDVMLKETGVEIEHIKDLALAEHLKCSIRGGLSFVALRHAARRMYFSDGWNGLGKEWPTCLLYLDANALYAFAMMHALPVRDVRWMTDDELESFDPFTHVSEEGDTGYILTVDLVYPEELHEAHNGYPLAAEQLNVTYSDLSEYSRRCLSEIYRKNLTHKAKKLSATFRPRRNYTLHALNLRLYLELGMKLEKIHKGVVFTQRPFMRQFIQDCAERRANSRTPTEARTQKLIPNSVYGKFIESQDKRMDCKFATSPDRDAANTRHPLYKSKLICGEDLTISFHGKKQLVMNQSWAVGFTILEISKYIMQSLYYKSLVPALGGAKNVSMVMSDTDSFLIRVRGHTEAQALEKLSPFMDFSNLPEDHSLFSKAKARQPGLLKSEVPLGSIKEVVALKAKTYAVRVDRHLGERYENDDRLNRAKGVKKSVKDAIPFEAYRKCVDKISGYEVEQRTLRSVNHVNRLEQMRKVAFTSFDDKRYQLCNIHSCPYGSVVIKRSQELGGCYFCKYEHKLT